MTKTQFITSLLSLLEQVLVGTARYTELQVFINDAFMDDKVPDDLPKGTVKHLFDLISDLKLIAKHQSRYAGSSSMLYSQEDIVERLKKYEGYFKMTWAYKLEDEHAFNPFIDELVFLLEKYPGVPSIIKINESSRVGVVFRFQDGSESFLPEGAEHLDKNWAECQIITSQIPELSEMQWKSVV